VDDSLSIIVPLRNAEASVHDQLHRLLDLLPDLTPQFEILVIDDGSRDHTADIAGELSRQYPQLRLIVHSEYKGRDAAIRTGLARATGRTILVLEDDGEISPTDLRRLWALRHDQGLVMARGQRQTGLFDEQLLERLSTWGHTLRSLARRTCPGGIQMIRRDGAHEVASDDQRLTSFASSAARTTAPTVHP
jgi:glycosyltransferase involved in cell wall biosynthesis